MNDATSAIGAPRVDVPSAAATLAVPPQLLLATLLALVVYYFVGYDQGAVSVFGSDTHVHEFLHDARHLLGFPCH